MTCTLEDLKKEIAAAPAGTSVGISYDVYEGLFLPGESDEGSREKAWNFARTNGCAINNRSTEQMVYFGKPK